tara:strand:- start:2589 stop:3038 length:450 start_codon:yes stop_codon:yes gene_type:complete
MPKKTTLKSRRNKRKSSLKTKSRKGGAVWDFLKSKEKPESKEEPEDDLKKVVAEEIPPVPEPKTFNQLQELFPEGIPLDIFNIDMEKIQTYKMMEKKFASLPTMDIDGEPLRTKPKEEEPKDVVLSEDKSEEPTTSNVPTPPDEDKLFV